MSILLTGKVSRLLARLGTPASSTIAAKLDTLHDTRVTADRAANLDKLDANVSAIASGGKRRAVQILTGSGNWAHPANVKDNLVEVTLVGGGGAGGRLSGAGNGGAGGKGGQIILRMPFVLAGGSTAYAVGAGGAGRATDGVGAAGSDTTFGLLKAAGATAGSASSASPAAGIDGTMDGVINLFSSTTGGGGANDGGSDGKAGGNYRGTGGAADAGSGGGGASWGNGGPAVAAGGAGANAPANSGAGGGGCNTGTSGAGGSGYILIEYEEASASGGGGGVTQDDLKKYVGQNLQTGTTYTLALTDAGKAVEMANVTANVVTIPTNATVPFPVDTRIDIYQRENGLTSIAGAVGVTTRGNLNSPGQNKAFSLWQRAIDDWYVLGGSA